MTRGYVDYTQRTSVQATGFDVDAPVAGWYRIWPAGALASGIRIWHGFPRDPVTGEELDRSPRWQAERDGTYVELAEVWPKAAKDPITQAEYEYLVGRVEWGRKHAPDSPQAQPRRKVDLLTAPLPF